MLQACAQVCGGFSPESGERLENTVDCFREAEEKALKPQIHFEEEIYELTDELNQVNMSVYESYLSYTEPPHIE